MAGNRTSSCFPFRHRRLMFRTIIPIVTLLATAHRHGANLLLLLSLKEEEGHSHYPDTKLFQPQQNLLPVTGSNTTNVVITERAVEPLDPWDKENFIIRILSWKRPKSLIESVRHHSKCPRVSQIRVVWSDVQGDSPPEELSRFSNVVVEHHSTNSLNIRFDMLPSNKNDTTTTKGVFSLDDDLLIPCQNLTDAFILWTNSPDRMVSFAPRDYSVQQVDGTWKYEYKIFRISHYSLGLTNAAFLHRDYLKWYTQDLPRTIYTEVDKTFNCEDIAMSLFVSSLTNGKPPLIALPYSHKMQHGAVAAQQDNNNSATELSHRAQHYQERSSCLERYATRLGLKSRLQKKLMPGGGKQNMSKLVT